MPEQQKNGKSQNEAADKAKLEDNALDDVQGGICGPGSCDPSKDGLDIIKRNPEQISTDISVLAESRRRLEEMEKEKQ
ncbi:hypothetical protein [Noviherbaspirillum pedocola]|uniref:Uncharacterized protein n=1 Tax=Noviherbaspirillum pedocola TaxID=2801341 RepID=A0A934SQH3_9BURK|nr:hypothetical protein [Noviherbaspirillum pedocola]MBK4734881.1 hypothetical protein [Noviherbaspirillum pedocola]